MVTRVLTVFESADQGLEVLLGLSFGVRSLLLEHLVEQVTAGRVLHDDVAASCGLDHIECEDDRRVFEVLGHEHFVLQTGVDPHLHVVVRQVEDFHREGVPVLAAGQVHSGGGEQAS